MSENVIAVLEVVEVGGELAIVFPGSVLSRLGAQLGDEVVARVDGDSLHLSALNPAGPAAPG